MVDVPWKRGAIRSTHLPWRQANVNMLSLRPMRLSNRTGNGGLYTTGQGPFQEERLTDHGYTKLFNAMSVSETAGHVCSPDDRVVSHTVVMVRRKDAFSPFHAHEGLLAVWNTYLALDLDPCETGILISDHLHDSERMGPFLEFHRRVFAPVHGVERVLEVSARQISTCYRRLIVAIDPAYCFEIPYLHEDRIKGNCGRSPWLIGFGRHVLASFGIPRGAHAERQIPHVTLPMRITYKREVGGHTGLLETMRVMENRVAFGGAIKRMCGTDDSRKYSTNETSSARCTASQKDFATLPMAKQIALASSTDVMVGTHGASFTFMIYMPPHGVIVEVETKTDRHFFNMARYLGLSHRRIGQRIDHHASSYVLDVREAVQSVAKAVDDVTPHVRRGPLPYAAPAAVSPRSIPWAPPGGSVKISTGKHATKARESLSTILNQASAVVNARRDQRFRFRPVEEVRADGFFIRRGNSTIRYGSTPPPPPPPADEPSESGLPVWIMISIFAAGTFLLVGCVTVIVWAFSRRRADEETSTR